MGRGNFHTISPAVPSGTSISLFVQPLHASVMVVVLGCAATEQDTPNVNAGDLEAAVVLTMRESQQIERTCLEVFGERPSRRLGRGLAQAGVDAPGCTSERLVHRITVRRRQPNGLVAHHHVACRDFCEPGDAFILTIKRGSTGKLQVVDRKDILLEW